jgi:hypothetical protein
VANVVIWASGYPSVFANDAAEIKSLQAGTWSPATKDFQAAATASGVALGAATFADVLKQIGTQKVGSIDRLGIIAHSNSKMIGLAGRIITKPPQAPDVLFTPSGLIDASVLKTNAAAVAKVKDRFAANASIVLFSCNAGADISLLIAFQTAFDLDCYGFNEHVQTCVNFSGTRITLRGQMSYTPTLAAMITAGLANPCTFAKSSVWLLQPDTGFFSRT